MSTEPLSHARLPKQHARRGCRSPAAAVAILFVLIRGFTSLEGGNAAGTIRDPSQGIERIREKVDHGDLGPAESLARRLVAEGRRRSWAQVPDLVPALDLLVEILIRSDRSDADETLKLAREAVTLHEERDQADTLDMARSLYRFGRVRRARGESKEAAVVLRRALKIQDSLPDGDELATAATLVQLGHALCESGEQLLAEPIYSRALEIRKRRLKSDDPLIADILNGQANLISDLGDYVNSPPLYEEALRIRIAARGSYDKSVAASKHNLAILYTLTNDFERAEQYYKDAREIWEGRFDPRSRNEERLADTLSARATERMQAGDYAEARTLLKDALKFRKPLHPTLDAVASFELNNLGVVEFEEDHLVEARRLFEKTLPLRIREWGEKNPLTATTLLNLGLVMDGLDEPNQARTLLKQSLDAFSSSLPPSHPDRADVLQVLARVELRLGEPSEALADALEAERVSREHVQLTAGVLPESQALSYASKRPSGLGVAVTLLETDADSHTIRTVWDEVIRSRALVLDEMAERGRFLHASRDPEVMSSFAAYRDACARLANTLVRAAGSGTPDEFRPLLARQMQERQESERRMAEKSAEFRRRLGQRNAGFEVVEKSLRRGSALVSYVRYLRPIWNPARVPPTPRGDHPTSQERSTEPAYGVFFLPERGSPPGFIPLGTESSINALVDSWLREAAHGLDDSHRAVEAADIACKEAGIALRKAIWDRLAPHLAGAKRVLIVPDGSLQMVNFGALPSEGDHFLVENNLVLYVSSAERDIVSPDEEPLRGKGLLAVGGPAFDETSLFAALRSPTPDPSKVASAALGHGASDPVDPKPRAVPQGTTTDVGGPGRRLRSACDGDRMRPFLPLAGARAEAAAIVGLWNRPTRRANAILLAGLLTLGTGFLAGRMRRGGHQPWVCALVITAAGASGAVTGYWTMPFFGSAVELEGRAADEGTLKRLAPGRRMLHIATHTFFSGDCHQSDASHDALELSGLALAGANHRSAAREDEEDGILTAEEVAPMDLSGVDWVVLSGCHTGGGEIKDDEGVAGLRRAFRIAGAETLVLSLWFVEDEPAREWMEALYRSRLLKGKSSADAARDASLSVLKQRRDSGQSTHPYYWAAFVPTGGWN